MARRRGFLPSLHRAGTRVSRAVNKMHRRVAPQHYRIVKRWARAKRSPFVY